MNNNQFEKITTGNGFQNDLIATTNNRLELTVLELQHLDRAFESQLSILKADIRDLKDTIKIANEESSRLQVKFLWLSIIATVFTVLQVVQVIDIIQRWVGK